MANQRTEQEEQRIRGYISSQTAFSETAVSLANKLDVKVKTARRVLDQLTKAGALTQQTFTPKIEPVYYHFRYRAG